MSFCTPYEVYVRTVSGMCGVTVSGVCVWCVCVCGDVWSLQETMHTIYMIGYTITLNNCLCPHTLTVYNWLCDSFAKSL